MGSAHRRRRSTLAVVVTVTTIVGVRLAVAGAAQPVAGPTDIPTVATPSAAPPAVTVAASPSPSLPAPSSPAPTSPAATAHRPATRSPSASPSPTPSPADSASPSSASPADSASPSGSTSPAPSVTSTGPPACDPGALRLGALGAAGNAGTALVAGSPVRFTVTLTSTATRGCVALPVVDLVITSGHDRIWTSADCPVAAVGGPGVTAAPALTGTARALLVPGGALLEPGASVSLGLVWPGVRSAGSCTAVPAPLVAGTYVAAVEVPGAGSTDEVFTLR